MAAGLPVRSSHGWSGSLSVFHVLTLPLHLQVVDVLLVSTEFKLSHILAGEICGVIYTAVNIVYYFTAPEDERIIYDILDWGGDTGGAVLFSAITLLILIPLFGFVLYGISRCVGFSSASACAPPPPHEAAPTAHVSWDSVGQGISRR